MRGFATTPMDWSSDSVLIRLQRRLGTKANALAAVFALSLRAREGDAVHGALDVDSDEFDEIINLPGAYAALEAVGLIEDGAAAGWHREVGFHEELAELKRDQSRARSKKYRQKKAMGDGAVTQTSRVTKRRGGASRNAGTSHADAASRERTHSRTPRSTDPSIDPSSDLPAEVSPPGGPAAPEAVIGELVPSGPAAAPMKAPPSNWVTRIGDVFAQRKGGVAPYGEVGRYLKPLHDLHGVEELERVTVAFLVAEDPTFATPKKLADTFGLHAGTHPARPLRPNGGGAKRYPGDLPPELA